MTYLRESQDGAGDLLDVHYFCSQGCWRDSFAPGRLGPATARARDPAHFDPSADYSGLTEGGASPCAAAEPGQDYDVHCAECGVLLASPDKQPPVVVNLIARPPIDPATGAAHPALPAAAERLYAEHDELVAIRDDASAPTAARASARRELARVEDALANRWA